MHETNDSKSFVLDVPHELRELFGYKAGQFCTFRVNPEGDGDLLRCYSMSSAPETDGDLTVTVKRVPDGRVSNWFNDRVAVGDVLAATKPAGAFVVRDGAFVLRDGGFPGVIGTGRDGGAPVVL